uniref:Uncharacterized protein n=1 Tax=Arundo donax TaxID=35708 RepID=A0A0A9LKF9_ARUDO
MMTLYPRIL